MKTKNMLLAAGATLLLASMAGAANAQIMTSGTVGGFSDYRLRGVSLSDKEGVIQGSLEAAVKVNDSLTIFAGAWASSLGPDDNTFGALETDLYVGAKGAFGDLGWSAKYLRLVYAEHHPVDFDQYAVELTYPLGPISAAIGIVQDEYPRVPVGASDSSTYIYVAGGYAFKDTPFSVKALVGHEDGAYGFDDKVNWDIGASYTFQKLTFSLDYQDTNKTVNSPTAGNLAGGTAVFAITGAF